MSLLEARGSKTRGFEVKDTGMTDMKDQYLKNTRAVEIANAKEMIKDLEGINVVQISTADAAFKRVKPLLDRLRDDLKAAAGIVAREYDALPKSERAEFADKVTEEYGWSRDRLQTFARIGREFPGKKKIIETRAGACSIDETNTEVLGQIVSMPDEQLIQAAEAGLFSIGVSKRQIIHYRKTGQLPAAAPKTKPTTDLGKIRALMVHAELLANKLSLKIGEITSIMEDSNITDAKGREATALIRAFERLCTKMATANPTTSKRAFEMLRTGEWRQ